MKRFVPALLLLAFLPTVSQAANGLTTEQRLEKLERRVGLVTDLTLRLDAVQRENRELRGEIETLQHQLEQLKRKQRDIYLDIDQRLSGM
jgi:TolA-binding protein